MKAYITFYKKGRKVEKVEWTLEKAKEELTKKEYEKLTSWTGISTSKMRGYVA